MSCQSKCICLAHKRHPQVESLQCYPVPTFSKIVLGHSTATISPVLSHVLRNVWPSDVPQTLEKPSFVLDSNSRLFEQSHKRSVIRGDHKISSNQEPSTLLLSETVLIVKYLVSPDLKLLEAG